MKYTFICPACKEEKTIECAMSELKGKVVTCDACGVNMNRKWAVNLIVPDDMRAENIAEMSWLNSRMQNLPSGKTKAIY